ncbi:MAG: hypothetical protein MK132_11285 [Lentisphaerales bacterium]|nr:hypothetical protein [Lentisphaerales bacterium]
MAKKYTEISINKREIQFPCLIPSDTVMSRSLYRNQYANSFSVQLPSISSSPDTRNQKAINYSEIDEKILSAIHNKFSSTGAQK